MDERNQSASADPGRALIEVVPLGKVDATAAAVAAANVQTILRLRALVIQPWPDPEYARMATRGQYNAEAILKALAAEGTNAPLRLGIVSSDLCLSFLTYVFGEAQLGGRAAVVSLYRLTRSETGSRVNQSTMYERLAKTCVHETAHLLGLVHCRTSGCLMCFTQNLDHLDSLRLEFCPDCRADLAVRLRPILKGTGTSYA